VPPVRPEDEIRARGSLGRTEARGSGTDPAGLSKTLLDGKEVAVRAEAAFLLGYLHAGSSTVSLRQALSDESARVRVEATLALARLGDMERQMAAVPR